jgi:hypothetical protein
MCLQKEAPSLILPQNLLVRLGLAHIANAGEDDFGSLETSVPH